MPHFFLDGESRLSPDGGKITLTGDSARHIALSLRMAVGDTLSVSDGQASVYECTLSSITPASVECTVLSEKKGEGEAPFPIHLYMAYPKGDKMETVIQKAAELGAASVTPFFSSRCIRRPAEEKNNRLTERYNKIAKEAAAQCGRCRVPTVNAPISFPEMLKRAGDAALCLFCYEGDGTHPLPALLPGEAPASCSIVVGSEGGFSEGEAEEAIAAGLLPTGLGKRILRCETAPLFVLSCLSYHYELGKIGKIE